MLRYSKEKFRCFDLKPDGPFSAVCPSITPTQNVRLILLFAKIFLDFPRPPNPTSRESFIAMPSHFYYFLLLPYLLKNKHPDKCIKVKV